MDAAHFLGWLRRFATVLNGRYVIARGRTLILFFSRVLLLIDNHDTRLYGSLLGHRL